MMMKTVRNAILLLWGVLICYPVGMKAQDKFDASVGMDLVSGYIWRGRIWEMSAFSQKCRWLTKVFLLQDGELLDLIKMI